MKPPIQIVLSSMAILIALICIGCSKIDAEVAIAQYYGDKKAAVSFTYDDGNIEHYTLIAPHLEDSGIRGSFWIIGSYVGTKDCMTWDHLKEMHAKGHEISNHSWTHRHMTTLSEAEFRDELKLTDDAIEEHLGKRPLTMTFPYNEFNAMNKSVVLEDHIAYRAYQEDQGQGKAFGMGHTYSTLDGMKAWLQNTIEKGEWGVTMTHGIHLGWDIWEDPQVYWDFITYAGTRSDDVWYGTFEQVAAYMAERDSCSFEVENHWKSVTVTPKCDLDSSKYTQPLTLRVVCDGKVILHEFDPFGGPFTVKL